jgi:Rap1a immunity proteins
MRLVYAIVALACLSGAAHAEMTAKQLVTASINGLSINANPTYAYLRSIVVGMTATNTRLIAYGRKPIYCLPLAFALTSSRNLDIISTFIAAHPEYSDYDAGLVLVEAMRETFPCQK